MYDNLLRCSIGFFFFFFLYHTLRAVFFIFNGCWVYEYCTGRSGLDEKNIPNHLSFAREGGGVGSLKVGKKKEIVRILC